MSTSTTECRRGFLKTALAGGLGALIVSRFSRSALAASGMQGTTAAPATATAPAACVACMS